MKETTTSSPVSESLFWRVTRRQLFLVAIGLATLGCLPKREEQEGQVKLGPEAEKRLRILPTGEKIVFWEPGKRFELHNEGGKVNLANSTGNLSLGLNKQGLEAFLREEEIELTRVGSMEIIIAPDLPAGFIDYRRAQLPSRERNDPPPQEFLSKASQIISSEICTLLFLSNQMGERFWRSSNRTQLFVNEQVRLLAKSGSRQIPPFSLWRRVPQLTLDQTNIRA